MKNLLLPLLCGLTLAECNSADNEERPPNIIYILADDLGYGELGAYGQSKIKTPNIDQLAQNGMLFTQHYSGAPVCAPARCVFLTGQHAGHAAIRGNDEWRERGAVWDYEEVFHNSHLEGQRPLPNEVVTLGNQLQQAGYITSIFGKWGLGAPDTEGVPTSKGFDHFYGYNCQRQAHNLYPGHLWEDTTKVLLDNELIAPNTPLDPQADPYNSASYEKYSQNEYAPEKIHLKALSFLAENCDHPFFMFYASPLPHLPLQAPKEWVDKYRAVFGEEEPYTGSSYFPNQYPRATYAAMISYLDYQVGEIVALLKEQGVYDNTIIIFSSDNGPTYLGGVDFEFFESSKPFSNGYGRTKGFVHEGGVRVPLIASWPNHITPGTTSDHISAFYDLMPTLCEIAGVSSPEASDGISFVPTLLEQPSQPQHQFLYWEFPSYNGQQAVRMGKWKGIRQNIFKGNMTIALYNLETDLEEQVDVAKQYPEIVEEIEEIMLQEHQPATIDKFKMIQLGDKKE